MLAWHLGFQTVYQRLGKCPARQKLLQRFLLHKGKATLQPKKVSVRKCPLLRLLKMEKLRKVTLLLVWIRMNPKVFQTAESLLCARSEPQICLQVGKSEIWGSYLITLCSTPMISVSLNIFIRGTHAITWNTKSVRVLSCLETSGAFVSR